jgi:hypothetical protein
MLRKRLTKFASFAVALLAWAVFGVSLAPVETEAQTQTGPATSTPTPAQATDSTPSKQTSNTSADSADLSITARITARELRFEKVPNPRVEFSGRPRRETVWRAERENLPEEVRPGVTYRDIGIRLRITSVFADIDRIVAEALGEVPASDDAAPQPQPMPEQQRPPSVQQQGNTSPPQARTSLRQNHSYPAASNEPENAERKRRAQARSGRRN